MDSIFGLDKIDQGPNFYELLGCDQNSSIEQINTEFKIKALKLHPDKNLNDEKSQNDFKNLLEAKDTLIDPKLRERYDQWLNMGMCVPWKDWCNFTEKNKTVFHWVYQKPNPMLASTDLKNSNEYQEDCDNLTRFRRQEIQNNDILSKFRNYKI